MRLIQYSSQFKKDIDLSKRRQKKMDKLKPIIDMLINDIELPASLRDHQLSGKFNKHRELHIEPDWLLIYSFPDSSLLRLERLGTHSDLFKKK